MVSFEFGKKKKITCFFTELKTTIIILYTKVKFFKRDKP